MRRLFPALLALLTALSLTACQGIPFLPPPVEEHDAEVLLPQIEELLPNPEDLLPNAEDILPGMGEHLPGAEEPLPGMEELLPGAEDILPGMEELLPEVEGLLPDPEDLLSEDGTYDSREDVTLYLIMYQHLPDNYITKAEARALGWSGGGLEPYAPGKCIGGDRFGNREGKLPTGHTYTECDIDTLGASSRGAKRIVFDEDFTVYYTADHYETFELLYGGDTP